MIPAVFNSLRRQPPAWICFLLAALVFPAAAEILPPTSTNTPPVEARRLREDLIKNRMQNDMFRQWGDSQNSMGGVLPRGNPPSLSPAQVRELKAKLDEQRYWMFADPNDAGKTSPTEEAWRKGSSIPSALEGLGAGTPRILQKYFDRTSGNHHAETNAFAGADPDARDPLDLSSEDNRFGKSAKSKLGKTENRSGVGTGESAAGKVISRLFQPNGGRTLEVSAAAGWFSAGFVPPVAIPMERSPETVQRMNDFQKLLNGSAAPASAYRPLPALTASSGGGSGGGNFNPAPRASGISGVASGSSLLGASSLPTLSAPPAPSIRDFQPPTPPRRRF